MANHEGTGIPSEELLTAVFKPVSESYYAERVKSGGNARLRAQAAQSTVTLFIGGIIAAFSITALHDSPAISRWAAAVAICCWMASSVLYMRAVAGPLKDPIDELFVQDQTDLVNTVLKHATREVRQIDRRQFRANTVAIAAVVATAVAFSTAVTVNSTPGTKAGEIVIDSGYVATLGAVCPGSGNVLRGEIESDTVDKAHVLIELTPALCGGRATKLYVPQAAVASMAIFGG